MAYIPFKSNIATQPVKTGYIPFKPKTQATQIMQGTKTWNGIKIPADVVTKNLIAYDPVTGIRTFKLPSGGAYSRDKNNEIVNTLRDYAGTEKVSGSQRDHVVPVALGGASTKENIQIQGGYKSGGLADKSDAEEKRIIDEYKRGELSNTLAIARILRIKQDLATQPTGLKKILNDISFGLNQIFPNTKELLGKLKEPLNIEKYKKGDLKTALSGAEQAVRTTIDTAKQNLGNFVLAVFKKNPQLDISRGKFNITKGEPVPAELQNTTTAEKINLGLKAVTSTINTAFAPVSAVFGAAESIPAFKPIAELMSIPFSAGGELGGGFLRETLKALPIPNKTKEALSEGVYEIGNLAGQLATGVFVAKATGIIKGKNPLREVMLKENPSLKENLNKIPNAEFDRLVKKFGVEDAKTIIKKSIEQADKTIYDKNATRVPITESGEAQSVPTKYIPFKGKVEALKPTPETSLIQEARKYKSAEEFVKKIQNESNIGQQGRLQEIPLNKIKGTDYPELDSALKKGKLSAQEAMDLLPDNEIDMTNSNVSMPIEVIKNNDGTYSLQAGNHRVAQQLVNGEKTIYANIANEKGFSTKSQLTDIWNKAQEVKAVKPVEVKTEINKPIEPVKTKTSQGELKYESTIRESGLARSVKNKAIQDKMIYGFDKRFRELPDYDRNITANKAKKATEYTLNNIEEALDVALGKKKAPNGLFPEDVYVAMDEYATATGNIEILRQLATESSLVGEATQMGQRIQTLSRLNPDSVVSTLQEVRKAKEAKTNLKDVNKTKKDLTNKLKEETNKTNLPKEELSWDRFLSKIAC